MASTTLQAAGHTLNLKPYTGRSALVRRLSHIPVQQHQIQQVEKRGLRLPVTAGLPVVGSIPVLGPVLNFALSPFTLVAAYITGAARFYGGYNKTTYSDADRLRLSALWPVLFVASQAFRQNFKKAIS